MAHFRKSFFTNLMLKAHVFPFQDGSVLTGSAVHNTVLPSNNVVVVTDSGFVVGASMMVTQMESASRPQVTDHSKVRSQMCMVSDSGASRKLFSLYLEG